MSRESWNKREWRYDPETLASGWVEVLDEGDPIVETGNVQVEFPWGNIPLQPNDDRTDSTVTASGTEDYGWSTVTQYTSDNLNPALDNHSIATGLPPYRFPGWNGYPGYLPGDNDNLPGNFVVPDVTGLSSTEAENVISFAGLDYNYVAVNNTGGATSLNNDTVASQSPTAGHTIEEGGVVTINVYEYVNPEVEVFSWALADWTENIIHPTDGVTIFAESGLQSPMLAATPSMASNGWATFYLRCTNVALDVMGMPVFIDDGDYMIVGSTDVWPGGAVLFSVDTSSGWAPFIPTGSANFVSGDMAIINKG